MEEMPEATGEEGRVGLEVEDVDEEEEAEGEEERSAIEEERSIKVRGGKAGGEVEGGGGAGRTGMGRCLG
jgi:hypothetical protein